jgi:hypothetical protein
VNPADLAQILTRWADEADTDQRIAWDRDQIGLAARLRGKSQGLRLAAAEIRRNLMKDNR